MLRVATVNVNGIRAAHRRGLDDWLATRGCDVVALQEVRAPVAALPPGAFGDYHVVYEPGQIPGRNGVAVLTRERPVAVRTWDAEVLLRGPDEDHLHTEPAPDDVPLARGLGRHAHEGRYVEVDLAEAPITVASLYLPKGGLPARLQVPSRMREKPDGGARYERKMRFMDAFARQLARTRRAARARGREFLLMGDLNVAHTKLDVASWRRSQTSEGFLPEERAWIEAQLSPRTLVDVVRRLHPDTEGPYTWWSWLGEAYAKDAGWRIDYHLATPRLARTATAVVVDRDHRGVRLSDHAPVVVDYHWPAV
ncbi:exodeoxyribonuclease III [Ornithinimicrobium tianjinense]|uniref:Exodeoxyribonuclease III n=1 Tax=Ornithinimicrobium tianjinense TaxID=1195761 RepID=A0A917BQJ2_9MICO|nr:exodeoxyribonuclease III [Ornithinimicrobium tianjinense]GGF53431.1 exodeoxyribonuclease III [Ornithinimicrobium tianjinense]